MATDQQWPMKEAEKEERQERHPTGLGAGTHAVEHLHS